MSQPSQLPLLVAAGVAVKGAAAGWHHSLILTTEGMVMSCGRGYAPRGADYGEWLLLSFFSAAM